jgi:hypothetical protein
MKAIVKKSKPTSYQPKTITIVLESVEEEIAFKHLLGCWDGRENCYASNEVREFAKKLWNIPEIGEMAL